MPPMDNEPTERWVTIRETFIQVTVVVVVVKTEPEPP
jgi:hypothetical protein